MPRLLPDADHYHLILCTFQDLLSQGMRYLNGRYAEGFNERYARRGHLFGGRFAAFVVCDEQHLRNATAYVLQNPVRAGLCSRATDWPWSGARHALSSAHDS